MFGAIGCGITAPGSLPFSICWVGERSLKETDMERSRDSKEMGKEEERVSESSKLSNEVGLEDKLPSSVGYKGDCEPVFCAAI